MTAVGQLSERDLIARLERTLSRRPDWLVVGIGDDAAVAEPPSRLLEVFTVDGLVEGIHFDRRFTSPHAIGYRALAVNLSDLAAMGASPRLALLSLALPLDFPLDDLDHLVSGLSDLADEAGIVVAGGNLTRSPGPLMIDITAVGAVKRRHQILRRGARAGDALFVTGQIGSAAAGLGMLRAQPAGVTAPAIGCGNREEDTGAADAAEEADACVRRYLYPRPRLRLGMQLARNRAATACIDLSDGLGAGVTQLAEASGVGATIDAAAIPIHPAARRWFDLAGNDPVDAAVGGGDDYELLFAVRPDRAGRLRHAARLGGVPIAKIGVCTADKAIVLRRDVGGQVTDGPFPGAFHHFG